jgi:hypothetical protein
MLLPKFFNDPRKPNERRPAFTDTDMSKSQAESRHLLPDLSHADLLQVFIDPQVTRDRRPAKSPVEKHAKSEKFSHEM